ncbi:MAG: glycosyltransferase family 2 protein [Candidatus Paceibacterota bacterium]
MRVATCAINRKSPQISIIIPVYNEAENIQQIYTEITETLPTMNTSWEIIFVDDGSTDTTPDRLRTLPSITIITFRRNFGQTAALDAGIKHAQGEYIVTLDGDGQNDPADIPQLIEQLETKKLDVVSGYRKHRKDTFGKRVASKLAWTARRIFINDGIHDSGCTLKVYRRECFTHIDLYGEMHRFIPGILKIKGFRIGEHEVNHRQRIHGKTKYTIMRGIRGLLDMFSVWFWRKYANRPLHLFGSIGMVLIFISSITTIWVGYNKIAYNLDLSDTALTIFSMFGLLIGLQFLTFGLIADILSKNYFATTKDEPYDIIHIEQR